MYSGCGPSFPRWCHHDRRALAMFANPPSLPPEQVMAGSFLMFSSVGSVV